MAKETATRRELLQSLGALPLMALLAHPPTAAAQAPGGSPAKVDTKGLTAKIKFESVLSGYLGELNGKFKLRVTELVLEPGGYVGEHHHAGPGIRQVTSGYMTYVLPEKTVVYGPGDFFFESRRRQPHRPEQDRRPDGPRPLRDPPRRPQRPIDHAGEKL
jgi:quercetin dioxygenase-like cupin family protein